MDSGWVRRLTLDILDQKSNFLLKMYEEILKAIDFYMEDSRVGRENFSLHRIDIYHLHILFAKVFSNRVGHFMCR